MRQLPDDGSFALSLIDGTSDRPTEPMTAADAPQSTTSQRGASARITFTISAGAIICETVGSGVAPGDNGRKRKGRKRGASARQRSK